MSDTPEQQRTADASAASDTAALSHPWADLPAEHFSLLRLAPLPVDRETGARPLRFLQLGRVERHSKELSLLRLSLQAPGQLSRAEQNRLDVWVDHQHRQVRFGPEQGLSVEPANRGLGRFLLAQASAWARAQYAHYEVVGGDLPTRDNFNAAALERRDHALRAQGFTVEYSDPLLLKARYSAPHVSALLSEWQTDKVQIVELLDAAAMLQQADQNLREQDIQLRKLGEQMAHIKREDSSLRFTLACLVVFCLFQAGLLIWIATH